MQAYTCMSTADWSSWKGLSREHHEDTHAHARITFLLVVHDRLWRSRHMPPLVHRRIVVQQQKVWRQGNYDIERSLKHAGEAGRRRTAGQNHICDELVEGLLAGSAAASVERNRHFSTVCVSIAMRTPGGPATLVSPPPVGSWIALRVPIHRVAALAAMVVAPPTNHGVEHGRPVTNKLVYARCSTKSRAMHPREFTAAPVLRQQQA